MLSRVRIQNYRSIQDATLTFHYAQRKAPNGYANSPTHPFIETAGLRLVPCMALYGPNASGKTAVLHAIASLVSFAQNKHPLVQPLPLFQPHRLKRLEPRTTRIELEWSDAEKRFCYAAAVAEDRITEETLSADGKLKFRLREGSLSFAPEEGREAVEEGLRLRCFDAPTKKQLRPALPVIAENFPGYDADINQAHRSLTTKIQFFDRSVPPEIGVTRLADTFDLPTQAKRESAALALITKYLQKFDVRIRRIEKRRTPKSVEAIPAGVHPFLPSFAAGGPSSTVADAEFRTFHLAEDGGEIPFEFEAESAGTRKLFGLLANLLTAVRTGGTVLADDFDQSLHPALLHEIVKLFQVRAYNDRKSQFVFTLHNTELLASDRPIVSEVAFVSQSGFQGTKVRRLSDFEDVRNVDNFRKRYLTGCYGAIPSPFI